MKYIFTLVLFVLYLPFMSSTYAQDCCNIEPEVTATPTADCEGIELCISGYEGCEDTWFKFHAHDHISNANYDNGGRFTADNCYTFTGLDLDNRLSFTVSVALPDECADNPMDLLQYHSLNFMDFSDCTPVDCCTTTPTATATPTADCEGVELCISGYEGCPDTWFKFQVFDADTDEQLANNGTFTSESCYTFTGLDLSTPFNFNVSVGLADECASNPIDLLQHACLFDIDFSDCVPTIDPCCAPPNIADVEFNQIPGFNWFQICMPEAPCPDEDGLLYGIRFLELCGSEPGVYSITSNRTNCLYFRYREGCEYRFQAGYHSDNCSPVEWSEEYIFNARLAGKTGADNVNNPLSLTNTSSALAYPNPFKEIFQIQFSVEKATAYQLNIYDLQGSLVLTLDGQSMEGENHITIDQLNAMPSGNYYYQLATDGQHFSNKIVKY